MAFKREDNLFFRNSIFYLIVAVSLFLVSFVFFYVDSIDKKVTGFVTYTNDWCDTNVCVRFFTSDSPVDDCIASGVYPLSACNYCLLTYGCPISSSSSGSSSGGSSGQPSTPLVSEISSSASYVSVSSSVLSYSQNVLQIVSVFTSQIPVYSNSSSNLPITSTQIPRHFSSSTQTTGSCNSLDCQQNLLIQAQHQISAAISAVTSQLEASKSLLDKYETDKTLKTDYDLINATLFEINQINSQIDSRLIAAVNRSKDIAKKKAEEQIIFEQKDEEVKEYYGIYEPFTPSMDGDIEDSCKVPVDYIVFREALPSGKLMNGEKTCDSENLPVSSMPTPDLIGPVNFPSSGIASVSSGGNSPAQVYTFFLGDPQTWAEENFTHEAVVIKNSKEGVLDINFMLAPSHSALKEKIDAFVKNLLFSSFDSESEENLGFSSQVSFVNEVYKKEMPYFLWVVLFVLFIFFFILSRLILSQNKLSQNLNDKQNVSFKKHLNFGGHHLSVEKMIIDALKEYPKNKKVATTRLSIISNAYKNLSESSREKLAPLYEELIYLIKKS